MIVAEKRIKLIVTGDMERQALAESLRQVFVGACDLGNEVVWERPMKMHCVTSNRLPEDPHSPSTQMQALARAMLYEAIFGKTGTPADLVVVIDDVELANLGQEAAVAAHFRVAVRIELDRMANSAPTRERYEKLLREKCSFHLLRPMVESYLFGDPAALAEAGVSDDIKPMLRHATDVEDFEVIDPRWLSTCERENNAKRGRHPWWCHERHPKHYLEDLVDRSGQSYDETDQGKRALLGLRWKVVPKQALDVAFLRALFEDLSDWFCVPNPMGQGSKAPHFYPDRRVNRDSLLLRNL